MIKKFSSITIFILIILSACKKEIKFLEKDATATPVPMSGLLARLDYNGIKKFEVMYNSSNLPVSFHYNENSGPTGHGSLHAFSYSSSLRNAIYLYDADSTNYNYQINYSYDSLNRLTGISEFPGHPVSYYYIIIYNSVSNISRVDVWRTGIPNVHLNYFMVNYPNDSTQEFTYYDGSNTFLMNVVTVFDKKVNPAFASSLQMPGVDFPQNILRQSSPQADSTGHISSYYYNLQRNNTYIYDGNYPLIKIAQSTGINPTYDTTVFYYK